MRKIVSINLTESDIDKALKELEDYKKEVVRKTELLRQKLAERLTEEAQQGFNGAISDNRIMDEQDVSLSANVTVTSSDKGDVSIVIASGEDAVWVEFGAGVYYNGSAGSSPNPYGAELGLTIGGYGTNGTKKTWGFYENGKLILTHGTPAKMPMANAITSVLNDIAAIAKEVGFG